MENPDVILELTRDEHGFVTKFEFKVNKPGEDGKTVLEACSLADTMLQAEGPEDHAVHVDARVDFPIMSD